MHQEWIDPDTGLTLPEHFKDLFDLLHTPACNLAVRSFNVAAAIKRSTEVNARGAVRQMLKSCEAITKVWLEANYPALAHIVLDVDAAVEKIFTRGHFARLWVGEVEERPVEGGTVVKAQPM